MPQLQLPIFPAGVTEINSQIAVQKDASAVWYIYGHVPVFQHAEGDVQSFRMFTSQLIASGTVKPKEIVRTFGAPMITVKRYMRVYRDHGAKGFYAAGNGVCSSPTALAPMRISLRSPTQAPAPQSIPRVAAHDRFFSMRTCSRRNSSCRWR